MALRPLITCSLLGAVLAGFSGPAAGVEAKSMKARVAAFLEIGWTRTGQARKDAQQQYDRLAESAARDWRLPYAYALVQIRQYRYKDAAKLLDQVIALDAKNLEANRLRLWIAVILKDQNKALAKMDQLAAAMPPETTDPQADAANVETAALLGRLSGFMEGPAKSSVTQSTRAASAERLDTLLTSARKDAFEKGRRAVLRQFEALDEETELTRADVKQAGEKLKARVIGELKRQAADLTARLNAEKARLAELNKSLGYDREHVKKDQESAVQRLQAAQAAAREAAARLRETDSRLAELYELANREKDPAARQQYLIDAANVRADRDRRAADINAHNQQIANEQAKVGELGQKRDDLESRWQRENDTVTKLEGQLQRTLRDKQRYETKPIDTNTGQTASQEHRSLALPTYVPLPVVLEDEKTRIVKLLE